MVLGIFNIGPLEFLIMAAAAVMLFGGDLPQTARKAARMLGRLRALASELGREFSAADDLPTRKDIDLDLRDLDFNLAGNWKCAMATGLRGLIRGIVEDLIRDELAGVVDGAVQEQLCVTCADDPNAELIRQQNAGCIIATHNHDLARKADRIVTIVEGRIQPTTL